MLLISFSGYSQIVSLGYQHQPYDYGGVLKGDLQGVTFDVEYYLKAPLNLLFGAGVTGGYLSDDRYPTNPSIHSISMLGRVGLVFIPDNSIIKLTGIIGLGAVDVAKISTNIAGTAELRVTMFRWINLSIGSDLSNNLIYGIGIRFPPKKNRVYKSSKQHCKL